MRFEYEKSTLFTIFYGVTGTEKTYFIRHFLKLYQDQDGEPWSETHQDQDRDQDQNQNQDSKNIIIVCKDEKDWINSESGKPYSDYNMCDINLITSKNYAYVSR